MAKRNVYREVTREIIKALREGVGPWIRPWRTSAGPHRNAFSGRPYRGVNVLLLNLASMRRGFTSNLWLTYREAKRLGGYVRPGEKGVRIIFWKFIEIEERDREGNPVIDPETGEPVKRTVPFARLYTVFNLDQTEGVRIPRSVSERCEMDRKNDLGERLLALPRIVWGNKAAYYPVGDFIELPPKGAFESPEYFYATAFHELIHWTGHPDRLARDLSGRFGDRSYAMEELIAEMGAAFLSAHAGLPVRKLQHPEYINDWLRVIENDRTYRAVFTAARMAQEACDWLLVRVGEAVQPESPEEYEMREAA